MNHGAVVFAGHGSPMNAIGVNQANQGWKEMGRTLPKPKVIIAVSAHWATQGTFVRTAAANPQINDMYGFPRELYEVHYEPAGSPEYAEKVLKLLDGIAKEDNSFGIDHGVWSVLSNMYPDADIPVVMISTDVAAKPETLYEIGRRLRVLREEGAMIFASGNVVHSLYEVSWDMDQGYSWADSFDETVTGLVEKKDHTAIVNYPSLQYVDRAVPTDEHFRPLLVTLGAAEEKDRIQVWNRYRELGSMSMTSYVWE